MTPRPDDDAAFLHGLLTGIARIEARCYAAMSDRGAPWPSTVYSAGGGASNPTWTAIRARTLGVPLRLAATTEAAIGTARLVAAGASA